MSWSRLLWWSCVALPVSLVFEPGCGGRVIQAQCADAGMRYCVVTDYCCPTDTVCGTGQPMGPDGLVCKIGDCCPPLDAGAGEEYSPPYIDNPGATMEGTIPQTPGVSAPPQPPQTRQ